MDARCKHDDKYCEILMSPLRVCANYLPKMGGKTGVDLDAFIQDYEADPLYHWIGFDSPLMFAAHKAAGGMTSLYRQLGIGTERLFRTILMDSFGLTEEEANWEYAYTKTDDATATRYLDGRLDVALIEKAGKRDSAFVTEWLRSVSKKLGIDIPLKGAVFEVREGYKSADSKRQNADLENLANAMKSCYLMTMALMSMQINNNVYRRYKENGLLVLVGDVSNTNPTESTYAFLNQVADYNLAGFFERNTSRLRETTTQILEQLLDQKAQQ